MICGLRGVVDMITNSCLPRGCARRHCRNAGAKGWPRVSRRTAACGRHYSAHNRRFMIRASDSVRLNIYAYVEGDPLRWSDIDGLAKWYGHAYSATYAPAFGIGGSTLDLWSECVCNRMNHIVVYGVGIAASRGINVSGTIGAKVDGLDDGSLCPDPWAFAGLFTSISAGATLGAIPIRPGPGRSQSIVGFGRGIGMGMSVGGARYGRVNAVGNSISNSSATIFGAERSVTGIAGYSFVQVIDGPKCCTK